MPAPVEAAATDPTLTALTVPPGPNGTKIRINEFPPGAVSPMHRTQSVDYGIVLSGEVVLVLDDTETVLRAGDVVVQRGTNHRWENRTPARPGWRSSWSTGRSPANCSARSARRARRPAA